MTRPTTPQQPEPAPVVDAEERFVKEWESRYFPQLSDDAA